MKTFLALASLVLLPLFAVAVPTPSDKPPKWEYAELSFRSTPGRPARVDPDGLQIEAVPATMTIRWITNDGEVDAKGWDDLADQLKVKGFKKEGSAALQKIRLLNILGSEGWEYGADFWPRRPRSQEQQCFWHDGNHDMAAQAAGSIRRW
jgi:hypothetical protein